MRWSELEGPSAKGGIDSVQRIALGEGIVPTTAAGARELGVRYWAELERCSRGVVHVRDRAGEITLVLAGVVPLFRFGSGQVRVDDTVVECRFPILGGARRQIGNDRPDARGPPADAHDFCEPHAALTVSRPQGVTPPP